MIPHRMIESTVRQIDRGRNCNVYHHCHPIRRFTSQISPALARMYCTITFHSNLVMS